MNFKFLGLVFDYNINCLVKNGRFWADKIYQNKQRIFSYSSASIASVLYHNPDTEYTILTDDVDMLYNEVKKYKVETKSLVLEERSKDLEEWKRQKYAFYPLQMLMKHNKYYKADNVVKLDNDVILKRPFDMVLDKQRAFVWKYERFVADGDPRWGEKLVCNTILGTDKFHGFNIGILGIHKDNHHLIDESINICNEMVNVDISGVTDVNSKIWHCSEQTAYNWVFHKNNIERIETNHYFDHYFDNKQECINAVKHLLR
jgi:hypothetical protein